MVKLNFTVVGVLVIFRLAGVPAVPVVVVPALNFGIVCARPVVDKVASTSAMAMSVLLMLFVFMAFAVMGLLFLRLFKQTHHTNGLS